jgi:hypothetical protein
MQPLYEQDILDVLAAPEGLRYRFRYLRRYLNEAALAGWNSLADTSVLVFFSLQQQAKYHDPIFFPIRRGVVEKTSVEAQFYFVEFTLGSYVSLLKPEADPARSDGQLDWAKPARAFAEYLSGQKIDRPYAASATLVADIVADSTAPLDRFSEQTVLFDRNAGFLFRTDSFRKARFVRFLRITPQGAAKAEPLSVDAEANTFDLTAGVTYVVSLLQAQPTDVTEPEPFSVSADGELIRVIGREGFDIASRYDIVDIPVHVRHYGTHEVRQTVLVIQPGTGVQGPRIRVPLRVRPPRET